MVRGVVAERPPLRRRVARLKESGNLGWSVAALVISLIALLPILAIAVIALKPSGDTWPHLIENVLPGALRRTLLLMAGVGALSLLIGTGMRVAGDDVPFSRAALFPMAAAPAARHPDLHHRLFLSRAARLFRGGADRSARSVRLARCAQLLVPRHPQPRRRDPGDERRALPLRLHHRAGELHRPVGVRAGSEPHARPDRGTDVLAGGPAAGAAGACRGRGAGIDGDAE